MMKSDADMAGMATDLSVRISWLEDQVSPAKQYSGTEFNHFLLQYI